MDPDFLTLLDHDRRMTETAAGRAVLSELYATAIREVTDVWRQGPLYGLEDRQSGVLAELGAAAAACARGDLDAMEAALSRAADGVPVVLAHGDGLRAFGECLTEGRLTRLLGGLKMRREAARADAFRRVVEQVGGLSIPSIVLAEAESRKHASTIARALQVDLARKVRALIDNTNPAAAAVA